MNTQETGISRATVISELAKSPHGELAAYLPTVRQLAIEDPDFLAHLIAWNAVKGQVRDARLGLPVNSLACRELPPMYRENSLAHLALLNPRELSKALRYGRKVHLGSRQRHVYRLVLRYLKAREADLGWFTKTALHFRQGLKDLYALYDIGPSPYAQSVLFSQNYPEHSVFQVIRLLGTLDPAAAAAEVVRRRIPPLVVLGVLKVDKSRMSDPGYVTLVGWLIDSMTPSQLVTHARQIKALGVNQVPELRAALESALGRAGKSTANLLKTTKAAQAMAEDGDERMQAKLDALQARQIETAKRAAPQSLTGDWAVLVDKSGSMAQAIEQGRRAAAALTALGKGRVYLIMFDTMAHGLEVTGKDYPALMQITERIRAQGGTSIGAGMEWLLQYSALVDGILVVSDGWENQSPRFAERYATYSKKTGKEPVVYFLKLPGNCGYADTGLEDSMEAAHLPLEVRNIDGLDEYAITNLIQTLRTNRYSLIQEVLDTKLLTLDEVFAL